MEDNILGAMRVDRLLWHLSWPVMISMLLSALYNLVDSVYVTRLGEEAFLALSYAYPVQTLMIAVCAGLGVGYSAVLSRKLGEGRSGETGRAVVNGFGLYLLGSLLFVVFGMMGAEAYLRFCTDSPEIAGAGTDYLRIVCMVSVGLFLQFPLERTLQTGGFPAGFMLVQGTGAVINLILDPVFIFGFHMGVSGAAWATVIGQLMGAALGFILLRKVRDTIRVGREHFHMDRTILGEILRIGLPAVVMQALSSFMSFGLNRIFRMWSETAVWVLGAWFRLQNFVFMPIFSMGNAMVTVISYSRGARNPGRITEAVRCGRGFSLRCAALGTALMLLLATPLLKICFDASPETLQMGAPAIRMAALSFCPAAVCITTASSLQAMGRSMHSLWLSLARQIVFLLPIAFLLTAVYPALTFLCFVLAESLGLGMALYLYGRLKREKIDQMSSEQA